MYIVICDLDNCFTDSREWMKHVPDVHKADKSVARDMWDKYQTMAFLAKPNKSVINFLLSVSDIIPIYFVTAREDRKHSREDAIHQIEKFSEGKIVIGDYHKLYMRREFDYRASAEVKKEIVIDLLKGGLTPVLAIDDEPENCQMFAEMGIPTKLYDIEMDKFEKYFQPATL